MYHRFKIWYWTIGCLVGLGISIWLFPSPGTGDVRLYQTLIEFFQSGGIKQLTQCITQSCPPSHLWNYPPIYLYVFFIAQIIAGQHASSFLILKTLISVFFFLSVTLLGYAGYIFHNRQAHVSHYAIRGMFMGLTGVSIIINSHGLGYIDIFTFPCMIASIILLSKRAYMFAGIFFAGAFLFKWLPIILLPFYCLYTYRQGKKQFGYFLIGLTLVCTIVSALAWGRNIIPSYVNIATATTQDPYFAAAPTLPWLWTAIAPTLIHGMPDGLLLLLMEDNRTSTIEFMYQTFKILFLGYYLWVYYKYSRATALQNSLEHLLVASVYVNIGYFFIATGVHENHLMIGVFCALILTVMYPQSRYERLYRRVDLMSAASMVLYYGVSGIPFFPASIDTIAYFISVALAFLYLFIYLIANLNNEFEAANKHTISTI